MMTDLYLDYAVRMVSSRDIKHFVNEDHVRFLDGSGTSLKLMTTLFSRLLKCSKSYANSFERFTLSTSFATI